MGLSFSDRFELISELQGELFPVLMETLDLNLNLNPNLKKLYPVLI